MTKPVQLSIIVDDEGVKVLKKTEDQLDDVGDAAKRTTGKLRRGFERSFDTLKKVKGMVFSLKGGIVALAAAMTVGAFASFGRALIGPARQVERMTVGFKVLTGDLQIAKQRLAELIEFARTTPFTLPEIFEAARTLRVFGLDTTENMRILGDAAATAQQPIQELAVWFGRLSTGQTGEALNRLQEMGVAIRSDFEAKGLRFNKDNSLAATGQQALDALARIVDESYGGMTQAQAETFDGMVSNFEDFVFQARLKLGTPLFLVVKGALGQILDQADRLSNSGKLEEWGDKLAEAAGNALVWLAQTVDFIRNSVIPAGKEAWETLKQLPDIFASFDPEGIGETLGESIAAGIKTGLEAQKDDIWEWLTRPGVPQLRQFRLFGRNEADGSLPSSNFVGGGGRFRPGSGARGSWAPDAVKEGVNRSDLASSMRELLENAKSGSGSSAAAGGDTTAGQSDFRDNTIGRPPNMAEFMDPGQLPPSAVPVNEGEESLKALQERSRDIYQQMVEDALDNLGLIQQGWLDFRLNTIGIVGDWFEDLADSSKSGGERFAQLVDAMKRNALRSIFELAAGWLKARVTQATGEKALQASMAATAATSVATSATETAASRVVSAAKSKEAAAKIFAAHASIPFAGTGIATGFVAQMQAVLSGIQFLAGGGVVGGGGARDSVLAALTPGEGVVNPTGMRTLGEEGLQQLNSGSDPDTGGGSGLTIERIELGGGLTTTKEDLVAIIEERLVPALEELISDNRLNLEGTNRLRG